LQIENGKIFRQIKLLRRCSKIIFQLWLFWSNFYPVNNPFHADLTTKAAKSRKDLSW